MHRALGNLRQVHTNEEEERDDAKCMKMKAAIGFRSLDIDGWITSMFSLVVSGRRRCIFLGSCMAAWVHLQWSTPSATEGGLREVTRVDMNGAGRPAGRVGPCMHASHGSDGIGRQQGPYACMHGRAPGLSRARRLG